MGHSFLTQLDYFFIIITSTTSTIISVFPFLRCFSVAPEGLSCLTEILGIKIYPFHLFDQPFVWFDALSNTAYLGLQKDPPSLCCCL